MDTGELWNRVKPGFYELNLSVTVIYICFKRTLLAGIECFSWAVLVISSEDVSCGIWRGLSELLCCCRSRRWNRNRSKRVQRPMHTVSQAFILLILTMHCVKTLRVFLFDMSHPIHAMTTRLRSVERERSMFLSLCHFIRSKEWKTSKPHALWLDIDS